MKPQHLVIVSTPRAGAHMLRSMLAADPVVVDIGAPLAPGEERLVPLPPDDSTETLVGMYEAALAERPGRLMLSHLKLKLDHGNAVRAAAMTGGRFILLTRRDRLKAACSLLYGLRHRALFGPPAVPATITPTRAQIDGFATTVDQLERMARLLLEGLPHVELAYEDISVANVSAAVAGLGLDLAVGEPTTVKSAPRLADYVTNLAELI